ncbi:MAG TPA: helicase-related protein [Pyrinomonadaceae bacterium]|nr:helicase-related protein [Pyrinomonadaceae bacterium]
MSDRSRMIEWIRGELVGPSRLLAEGTLIEFAAAEFADPVPLRRGPLVWRPNPDSSLEEVLYYERESPHRKYGAGLLHPGAVPTTMTMQPDDVALHAADTIGAEPNADEVLTVDEDLAESDEEEGAGSFDATDDFEVSSPDIRHPSTVGISFCVKLNEDGRIIIRLPQSRRFVWQEADSPVFAINGRYEPCKRRWTDDQGRSQEASIWRRHPAMVADSQVIINRSDLVAGRPVRREVAMPENSPLNLRVEVFPRFREEEDIWLLTIVLRNSTQVAGETQPRTAILYQTYFEIIAENGRIEKYPESQRPFEQLDSEEQSLALLYREAATWGIGHGCSAGWDAEPGHQPTVLFADVMPAVQVPSMTPDIENMNGQLIQLSMRSLAALSDDGIGPGWQSLENLSAEYTSWMERARNQITGLDARWQPVARRHLDACEACLARINNGISLLRNDPAVRTAFRLANLAMLLQQIGTKQLTRRHLNWDATLRIVAPEGSHRSPWDVFHQNQESDQLGAWRAFQIAFLLMSLDGVRDGRSSDREIVDLIWFPTGGGKTEAYLAVMAFYMFHQRLLIADATSTPRRDGTNVLMRYTLRMLTTQQFQRAASLVCAMEFLRRQQNRHGIASIPGQRFSLGLWIGGDGSPNKIDGARTELKEFRRGFVAGNPLVLTECPWCRAEIGRYEGSRPSVIPQNQWNTARTRGITDVNAEGPLLHCTDAACSFGQEEPPNWLPVEVIDERIYRRPPSLVIATADKLAIVAYRPEAGALFGRVMVNDGPFQVSLPPGLIIQDELHLISGPLGTVYALYEAIFERLCSIQQDGQWIKPKLVASTATIRGAAEQVKSLYARSETQLFPSPGLMMGDSFFGRYARDVEGRLRDGRLYLGIHASDYGSALTTQVRAFSSALFRPYSFPPDLRDPWWTLLTFYNSIRELGGAKTLFDSDIRSRLKFMFNREGFAHDQRRNLRIVEELTSRLSQAEIVDMMDRLSKPYVETQNNDVVDACLASNIIEVGVDIDRLSIMGVVGQPKTTATYIQVTGRIGRRWWERAGLVLMIYNPSKSRDRSHFEQFHSYHRRLYERVEPTSATPFALSAIQRALPGALITWARQHGNAPVQNKAAYASALDTAYELLRERCQTVQLPEDQERSLREMERVRDELEHKWTLNPQDWEEFPPSINGEYLMLWPGQFATLPQKQRGVVVPSSMRQVDANAELSIDQGYVPVADS